MATHRVTVQETRVGGKPVCRGDEVTPSARELAAAPWAFEPVEGAPPPEVAEPVGLQLFKELMVQDRGNAVAAESNQKAQRQRAAEQHVAMAMRFLGVKTKANPLAMAMRLVDLMGYDPDEDEGGDPLAWADRNLEDALGRMRLMEQVLEARKADLSQLHERLQQRDREVAELQRRLAAAEKAAEVTTQGEAPKGEAVPAKAPEPKASEPKKSKG